MAPSRQRNLSQAKSAKNDEFYTQYEDIEREMNAYLDRDPVVFADKTILLPCDDPEWSNFTKYFAQNFEKLRLKKLISTSYAPDSKLMEVDKQPTLFESESPQFDPTKTEVRGKIYTLTRDTAGAAHTDLRDVQWEYLNGDGDFRSDEVRQLRDEADVIITNPPFSLFREFLAWIDPSEKQFLVIGNMNAITYKEVFPLIKQNSIWLGNNAAFNGGAMFYEIPESIANPAQVKKTRTDEAGKKTYITRVQGVRWFTNLDHGRRHQPIPLMTEAENIKFSKNMQIKDVGYKKYDNYDAIEVPLVKAIPSDYTGVMGVPISFLDKYSPDQFEILGITDRQNTSRLRTKKYTAADSSKYNDLNARSVLRLDDGAYQQVYARLLIKHRRQTDADETE